MPRDVAARGMKIPCGMAADWHEIVFPISTARQTRPRLLAMQLAIQTYRDRAEKPAIPLVGFAGALLFVAAATIAARLIANQWGNDPVVLLYIPAVLAAAILWGLWPALVSAVAATLAYNFWFTVPYHTLRIDRPVDVVTVLILFAVAVVTSQLAGRLRDQARLADAHAARNATVAGFARRLLSSSDREEIAQVAVDALGALLDCNVALLAGGEGLEPIAANPAPASFAPSDLAAAGVTFTTGEPTGRGLHRLDPVDWQFRPVRSDREILGVIGLARADGAAPISSAQVPLLESLLDQVALALVRARAERDALDIARLRERDNIRSALLASIGEDVKPRLHSIGNAARALRRAGVGDKAAIAEVANEAAMLDRYIDNLVEVGPGNQPEALAVRDLTIDLYRRSVLKGGAEVHLTPKEYAVLAELAKHAGRVLTHSHLLRAVWGPAHEDQIDYLRVAIRALRQKLEDEPAAPRLILNEPAVGYRLASEG